MTGAGSRDIESWSWAEVCARRLARHHLARAPGSSPVTIPEVVSDVGAVHAQVLSAAELSVGLRVPGTTRSDVQVALWDDRSLVKTFGPRGTVHLLATEDLPRWIGALNAVPAGPSPFQVDVRLTPDQTEAVVAAVDAALSEAALTVDELSDAVIAGTGSWAGDLVMPAFGDFWPRWRQALTLAANRGALCFGPNRGRNVTYTNPRRWRPELEAVDGAAALAWLVRKYLHAFGPATPEHFAQWLSASKRWASELFATMGGELRPVEVAGTVGWVPADDRADELEPEPGGVERVHLLPYFDAYTVGCQPRELVFPGAAAARALARGQAGNYPVLFVDGIAAGVWYPRRRGRKLDVTVEPLGRLRARTVRAVEAEVERIGEILEASPTLTIGAVTVGAHA